MKRKARRTGSASKALCSIHCWGGFILPSTPHLKANVLRDRSSFSLCRNDGNTEGPEEKELKKKEKQRLEKEKKELKEKQERERKEQKEREKKENEMKKKFKVSGLSEQRGMKGEPGVGEGGVYILVHKPAWIHSLLQSCGEEIVQESV